MNSSPNEYHLAVNNPTDAPITTTLKKCMDLPGFVFADTTSADGTTDGLVVASVRMYAEGDELEYDGDGVRRTVVSVNYTLGSVGIVPPLSAFAQPESGVRQYISSLFLDWPTG